MNETWRRLSMLSSMCKDKALSRQHPFFHVIFAGLPIKAFPRKQAKVDVSVF